MRESYKTKQKELVENEIKSFSNEFTIKELFAKITEKDESVGLTTVYRIVNNLQQDNVIVKHIDSDGTPRYRIQEDCEHCGHCMLKCESCGKLIHTDCNELDALSKHFINKHHFAIDQKDITIYGVCKNCRA